MKNIFIKVVNGVFVSGYNPTLLAKDYPELPFDFLREDNPDLNQYGIYICNQLDKPQYDDQEFNCIAKDPEPSNGDWIQTWQLIEKSPEEKRLARYKPVDFLLALQSNQNCINWSLTLNPILYGNFLLAVSRAIDDDNWIYVQSIYDQLKLMSPHIHGEEFTNLATFFGISLSL